MKKARLIVTYECQRNCAGCCNKNWRGKPPTVLKNIDQLIWYDEVCITGGEPVLFPTYAANLILDIKYLSRQTKVYVYTAAVEHPKELGLVTRVSDGICLTIHTQKDMDVFEAGVYKASVFNLFGKSMRLNIFKGVAARAKWFTGWKVKTDLEWRKDCPLPEGEELFVLEQPWTRTAPPWRSTHI